MMMISLDSPQRSSFRRDHMRGKARVVVSSEREAQHFIDLAGFAPNDLIICGLPKFDQSYANADADKILIMPTWRHWEFNAMKYDPQNTGYLKMIDRLKSAVPEQLQDKVVVAFHPLFNPDVFDREDAGEKDRSYDDILRKTRLLITDYSSIAFDAFYRGANVIFYWEELSECMEHYGEPTRLMIDDRSAFGDVCYNRTDLTSAITKSYYREQNAEHLARYRELVAFHDGRNTERLLARLHEDFKEFFG
jgi:CDP-glycerol glycerophosphotransferase (TagB/SpsB family)